MSVVEHRIFQTDRRFVSEGSVVFVEHLLGNVVFDLIAIDLN